MSDRVADLRTDYGRFGLNEAEADPDTIRQCDSWIREAVAASLREPNAMTLATCTPDGVPSARIVLLRGYDKSGFCFFTNYDGRKGRDLAANPRAALVLFWPELERQVRIEGLVSE